jgi:hypothetical protein
VSPSYHKLLEESSRISQIKSRFLQEQPDIYSTDVKFILEASILCSCARRELKGLGFCITRFGASFHERVELFCESDTKFTAHFAIPDNFGSFSFLVEEF